VDAKRGDTPADDAVDLRDRSLLALLEIGAAATLVWSLYAPWYVIHGPDYTTWIGAGGYSPDALLTQDLLIPFAAFVGVIVTIAGLVLPARGAKVAILAMFSAAFYGAVLQFQEVASGDQAISVIPPTPTWGLWLFTGIAAAGVALAIVDIVRGGSSTFLWRAVRRPSMRRYGLVAAYAVGLLVTLPIVLFPMFPNWWLYVWLVALVMLPVLFARIRKAAGPAGVR